MTDHHGSQHILLKATLGPCRSRLYALNPEDVTETLQLDTSVFVYDRTVPDPFQNFHHSYPIASARRNEADVPG
jgi:hypothetical protein